eukprot:m.113211 g.113211  ORF g.113211 m.113211 type:complete len:328 (+) comp15994_c2_seq2:4277-5260(+)
MTMINHRDHAPKDAEMRSPYSSMSFTMSSASLALGLPEIASAAWTSAAGAVSAAAAANHSTAAAATHKTADPWENAAAADAAANALADSLASDWVKLDPPFTVTPDEYMLDFSDGGCMENYGLPSLLRRKVQRIVVFINSAVPLQTTPFDPTKVWTKQGVDPYLPPLFGYHVDMSDAGIEANYNQVFEQGELMPILQQMQQQKALGNTVTAMANLNVLPNARWGIIGGWTASLLFVHLDRISKWEQALSADVLKAVFTAGIGSSRFPNYRTIDENPMHRFMPNIMTLYPSQVLLLADLTHYALTNGCPTPTYLADFLKISGSGSKNS